MELTRFKKVKDGKYLKNYELIYLNKNGVEKKYEMVSRQEIPDVTKIGNHISGISIVGYQGDRMLLLQEFRMAVNRKVYNLCAGMLEANESIEDCVKRELYEETGLEVESITYILPPSFGAVAISDVKTQIVFAKVKGDFADHTSANESIHPAFYSKEEIKELLRTQEFSSRAQMAAFFFIHNPFTS